MSTRENILSAIAASMSTKFRMDVPRNRDYPADLDDLPDKRLVTLYDGSGDREDLLNRTYVFSWRASLELIAQDDDEERRRHSIDEMLDLAKQAVDADPTFGGLADGTLIETPEISPNLKLADGTVPFSLATLPILFEFTTTSPTG